MVVALITVIARLQWLIPAKPGHIYTGVAIWHWCLNFLQSQNIFHMNVTLYVPQYVYCKRIQQWISLKIKQGSDLEVHDNYGYWYYIICL